MEGVCVGVCGGVGMCVCVRWQERAKWHSATSY